MYTYALMHLQRIRWRSSRAYQGREISLPPNDHKAHFAIPSQLFSFVPEISTNLNSSLHDQFLELQSSMLVLITFMCYLFWLLTKVAYVQCGVFKSFIVCHSPKMLDPPNQSLDHLSHSFALHSYALLAGFLILSSPFVLAHLHLESAVTILPTALSSCEHKTHFSSLVTDWLIDQVN
jgi:hypothetical protein